MQKTEQKFFLAANSAEGFISYFADSYIPREWRAYIIKGGPGTGKSSFMKYLAAKASDKGYSVILCPCSSDPDSLDGVIIKETKTVILDGTAPHVVEPVLAGACENIINLGEFWDSEKLFSNAKKIAETAEQNSKLHKTASVYLSAAGELLYDNLKLSRLAVNRTSAIKTANRLACRLLPVKTDREGREFIRFIGGTTPKGIISFSRTVTDYYKNIVAIEDKFGGASGEIMSRIRTVALKNGYDIITLKNPLLPNELIDHILVPELSLAFVTENEFAHFDTDVRRIHARRFTSREIVKKYKARMIFNKRVSKQLLLGAVNTLVLAKSVHDRLEKFYINSMDFKALSNFAVKKAQEIIR